MPPDAIPSAFPLLLLERTLKTAAEVTFWTLEGRRAIPGGSLASLELARPCEIPAVVAFLKTQALLFEDEWRSLMACLDKEGLIQFVLEPALESSRAFIETARSLATWILEREDGCGEALAAVTATLDHVEEQLLPLWQSLKEPLVIGPVRAQRAAELNARGKGETVEDVLARLKARGAV